MNNKEYTYCYYEIPKFLMPDIVGIIGFDRVTLRTAKAKIKKFLVDKHFLDKNTKITERNDEKAETENEIPNSIPMVFTDNRHAVFVKIIGAK